MLTNGKCWCSMDCILANVSREKKKQHPPEGILSFKKRKYQVWYVAATCCSCRLLHHEKYLWAWSVPALVTPHHIRQQKNKRKAKINRVNNTVGANLFLKSELLKVRERKVVKSLVNLIKRFWHVDDASLILYIMLATCIKSWISRCNCKIRLENFTGKVD